MVMMVTGSDITNYYMRLKLSAWFMVRGVMVMISVGSEAANANHDIEYISVGLSAFGIAKVTAQKPALCGIL